MECDHSAPHSGGARCLRAAAQLRLVLVCDRCGAERAELGRIDYRPNARRFIGHLAELTAHELRLSEPQIARVRLAALLCDAGRDQIPEEILNKQGPLTDEEWVQVRRQPELGAALLSDASLDDVRAWILSLRERPDGRGYPHGRSGGQIPLESLILAVIEAYVAMTSERPHRPARDHEDASHELLDCAGTQFDAAVVHAFVRASLRRNPHLRAAAA
jgi:HD-GYP domain-containing protein (c-di-GMP phosphodiesterase class II)